MEKSFTANNRKNVTKWRKYILGKKVYLKLKGSDALFGIISNIGPWEILLLLVLVVPLIAYCKIWAKAGYSWAWGLTALFPVVNIIGFFVLGFSKWPIENEMERLGAGTVAE